MEEFDDFLISTQTLIVAMNISIDCQEFFDFIACKSITQISYNKTKKIIDEPVEEGEIIFAQYKHEYKGTPLKKIKEKYFLNSVTMIMKIDTKFINIKVSNKGKLQITGCSQTEYAVKILKKIWALICPFELEGLIWKWNEEKDKIFKAKIIPVMCNINFSIGFHINREVLNHLINTETKYVSILETSDGYVGVNIKVSSKEESIDEILVDEYICEDREECEDCYQMKWTRRTTSLKDYIETLSIKEQRKKTAKCYVNTFLVFYSGKVIMSGGISYKNRKKAYHEFMGIIKNYKTNIISQ